MSVCVKVASLAKRVLAVTIVVLLAVAALGNASAVADDSTSQTYADGVTLSSCILTAGQYGDFTCSITSAADQPGPGALSVTGYYGSDPATPNGYTNTHIEAGQAPGSTLTSDRGLSETLCKWRGLRSHT